MTSNSIEGKIVVITGAGSGIGRATARLFADNGATIVVADWVEGNGRSVVAEVQKCGGQASFRFTDVSKSGDVERLVNSTLSMYGRLDIMINNAAVQVMSTLVDTTEETWDRIHNVNLKGVFLCCKYAIPAMVENGGGAIINMASVLGFVGDPDLPAYCAAKGGVIALTKAAALAYGPAKVRVNCICPGDVETPLLEAYLSKAADPTRSREMIESHYALRRVAGPQEVAQTALFLASENSSFITGCALVVDGGLTVKCY